MTEQIDAKSNVTTILPPLFFNKSFLQCFVHSEPPSAALGLVEIRGLKKGFLAIKITDSIEDDVTANDFDLGTQLLGNDDFAMLHLILNFSQRHVFDVVVDLGSSVSKRVLAAWKEQQDYFFFLFTQHGGLTAFSQELGPAWNEYDYFGYAERAKNSQSRYLSAVASFTSKDMAHGTLLEIILQNEEELLVLDTDQRFEVRRSYR